MKLEHLHFLICPACDSSLKLNEVSEQEEDHVVTGQLCCESCATEYPVVRSVPRFVPRENYASGFGLQWTEHAKTQYDSYTGTSISEDRFFNETGWSRDLAGEVILEVGSGSGRFTEQALTTGAMVISLDYSYAVDANNQLNGGHDNLLLVQGDVRALPFRRQGFDKVFCFGMIQHTPDPEGSFRALPPCVKPGGELVVDVYYKNRLGRLFSFTPAPPTKYWVRPFTTRIEPARLYKLIERYIDTFWPLANLLRRIPRIGRNLNWMLLIADHSDRGLPEKIVREWACLNTFDMLAPKYDLPQTLSEVYCWFQEADLAEVIVERGYNGIVGRGKPPPLDSA